MFTSLDDVVKEQIVKVVWEEGREGLVIVDKSYKIVACNKAFCDMTKYSEKEVIGRDFSIFSVKSEASLEIDHFTEILNSVQKVVTYVRKFVTKTDRVIIMEAKAISTGVPDTLMIMSLPPDMDRVPPELISPKIDSDALYKAIAFELVTNFKSNKLNAAITVIIVTVVIALVQKFFGIVISPEMINTLSPTGVNLP